MTAPDEWIITRDELPEHSHPVLITLLETRDGRSWVPQALYQCMWNVRSGERFWDNIASFQKVIAWKHLPEAYERRVVDILKDIEEKEDETD